MTGWFHKWVWRGPALLGWVALFLSPFLSHVAITTGRFTGVSILLAAIQAIVLAAFALGRKERWHRGLGLAAATGLLVLLVLKVVGSPDAGKTGLIASSGLTHAMIYLSLLILFGRSLRPGGTALVTRLALRLRGTLTPAMRAYTRTVTKAWGLFFAAQLVLSAVLLGGAPDRVWSLFVNVLDGPLVMAMFLAEFAVRRWRFRHDPHYSPLAVARSFVRDRARG